MAKAGILLLLYSFLLSALLMMNCHCQERKLYIVYMGGRTQQEESVATKHHSMLSEVLGSVSSAKDSLVYNYERSFDGFAAKMTKEEAARISDGCSFSGREQSKTKMEGVISVNPNRMYKLHTTRSWDFMNLTLNTIRVPKESDVIIGLLDTGVWPKNPCFDDTGMSHPPTKWKGTCTKTTDFTCNKSLELVTTSFLKTTNLQETPASTASGVEVEESYYGLAKGIIRGGVPNSRIAVYKVCSDFGCASADILKAFDDAIADGVDIISVSLGSTWPQDYLDDSIAIGSFHAMRNGILTSCRLEILVLTLQLLRTSLLGPSQWPPAESIENLLQEWNSETVRSLLGIAINSFDLNGTSYPLIWGGDAANYTGGSNQNIAKQCGAGAMNTNTLSGKIVFCETLTDSSAILDSNGAGIIMTDVRFVNTDMAYSWPLPSTLISPEDGKGVLEYIKATDNPIATILYSDEWKDAMAPTVASFSSRGPNPISPDILKPDITAPGVDIIAGWSPLSPSSVYDGDTRSTLFNIISGTSMSCPHASGAAAYVKSVHPKWSPAAIKSALMTTAYVMEPRKHDDLEFAYGSGHINPVAAQDPGLVFDASEADYINFLCKQGYTATTLRLVTGHKSTCANISPGRAWDLNYPSFSLYVEDGQEIKGTFTRTVTNVGPPKSTYRVGFDMPASISVTVRPSIMTFSAVGQTRTFTVTVTGPTISQQPIMSGTITWTDGTHIVRTPLVVYNYIPRAPYNINSDQYKTSAFTPILQRSSMYHINEATSMREE
ncbi:hypothetical protein OROHE_006663 [Orobanche hederae]